MILVKIGRWESPLDPCYASGDPWTKSLVINWELVKNRDYQTHPRLNQILHCNRILRLLMYTSWFERYCCRSVVIKGGACPTRGAYWNHLRYEQWPTLITTSSLGVLAEIKVEQRHWTQFCKNRIFGMSQCQDVVTSLRLVQRLR